MAWSGQAGLAFLACLLLSGCFVRLPYHGSAEERGYVGKEAVTKLPLDIYTCLDGNVAIDPPQAWNDVGPAQRKIASLPKGTVVKVRGMTHRITPWNTPPAYICRALQPKVKFDVYTSEIDKFLDWSSASAAQVGSGNGPTAKPSR